MFAEQIIKKNTWKKFKILLTVGANRESVIALTFQLQSDIFKGKFLLNGPSTETSAQNKSLRELCALELQPLQEKHVRQRRKSCCEFARMINKSFISSNSQKRCAFSCARWIWQRRKWNKFRRKVFSFHYKLRAMALCVAGVKTFISASESLPFQSQIWVFAQHEEFGISLFDLRTQSDSAGQIFSVLWRRQFSRMCDERANAAPKEGPNSKTAFQ